ncbi:tetrathionate reductase family octaheme c-type cytochrome [Myxococcota bacterium]|nr:tetrathionate reductase family octaheme c-type cytochrome [Myxococcota bacterium]MBU1896495.1 tetrathionate reductase family octaheme c-type cytochrome [Myxococcota bacterium]
MIRALFSCVALIWMAIPALAEPDAASQIFNPEHKATADHSKFEILHQDFQSGPEVTQACLECHNEAAHQVMQTSHWNWRCPKGDKGECNGAGKAEDVVNNFCISVASNEPRCTSCHAGYGWKDKSFDHSDQNLVDCLVCHDQTGTYKKYPTDAGHPIYKKDHPEGKPWPAKGPVKKVFKPVDLTKIAQSVAKPKKQNCGSCHFFGGGGEEVKHGDLDTSLVDPPYDLDVHMNKKNNFSCTTCHTTHSHKIAGRCFTVPAYDTREFRIRGKEANLLACESCHSEKPHKNDKLNDHTDKVSCEACHIPRMSRAKPTKMWWDWSLAGKMKDGKPYATNDKEGKWSNYDSKKGEFIWASNHEPEYVWFNGRMDYLYMKDKLDDQTPFKDKKDRYTPQTHGEFDKIDDTKPVVEINWSNANYNDPKSRIYPVKIHRGKQPYDPVNKTFVNPKLFPSGKDANAAYWKSFDWDKSIQAGMSYAELDYSGKYDFIQTQMVWPLKHMVAPAKDALRCEDCHRPDGRLAHLKGFYMPGRDRDPLVDGAGLAMILGALLFAFLHGLTRLISRRRQSNA